MCVVHVCVCVCEGAGKTKGCVCVGECVSGLCTCVCVCASWGSESSRNVFSIPPSLRTVKSEKARFNLLRKISFVQNYERGDFMKKVGVRKKMVCACLCVCVYVVFVHVLVHLCERLCARAMRGLKRVTLVPI